MLIPFEVEKPLKRQINTNLEAQIIQNNTLGAVISPLNPVETAIWEASQKYGIEELYDLAWCESRLNPEAIGDEGTSYGLFQWKLKSWVYYNKIYKTKLNILDYKDQIELTAKVLKDNGWNNWKRCYETIKGRK